MERWCRAQSPCQGCPCEAERRINAKNGIGAAGRRGIGSLRIRGSNATVELGWEPVAVAGVSIGAATAAAVAGARDGDVCASIKRLWHEITLKPLPYWPSDLQATFSLFGNPGFWRTRNDFHRYSRWTNLYDNSPMYETLIRVCDFDRLNDPSFIRLAVTATNVQTGDQVSFSNYAANPDALHYVTPRISRVRIAPAHIIASGSLPPGFPMTVIDGVPYWDGGLFDNTPIESLLDLLEENELENLPIFVVNLFATHSKPPKNLREVQERMLEISFESRFLLAHADADGSLTEFTTMIEDIRRELPQNSPVRAKESFQTAISLSSAQKRQSNRSAACSDDRRYGFLSARRQHPLQPAAHSISCSTLGTSR
jgi:NTE family protein